MLFQNEIRVMTVGVLTPPSIIFHNIVAAIVLVEETELLVKNNLPLDTDNSYYNVVSSTPLHGRNWTHNFSGAVAFRRIV